MKKILLFAAAGVLAFTSCSKASFDEPQPTPQTPVSPTTDGATEAEIQANVKKVFGVTFSPDQDWISAVNGTVTFNIDASVKKVAVLAVLGLVNEEGEEYNSMKVLNETDVNNQSSVSLSYDAPAKNGGLYAAFYTSEGCSYQKIEGATVSFTQAAARRARPSSPSCSTSGRRCSRPTSTHMASSGRNRPGWAIPRAQRSARRKSSARLRRAASNRGYRTG